MSKFLDHRVIVFKDSPPMWGGASQKPEGSFLSLDEAVASLGWYVFGLVGPRSRDATEAALVRWKGLIRYL